MALPLSRRTWRIAAIVAGGLLLLFLAIALWLLTYGWSQLRGPIEQRLSARLGRPVHIGAIHRIDHGFSQATLAIDDIKVAQPDWVGGGEFASIRSARVELPIWPVLRGAIRPETIALDGLRLHLIRRDTAHANWKGIPGGKGRGGPGPRQITITDGGLRFDDFKQGHFFRAKVAADASGFRLGGTGTLIGRPTTLTLTGASLSGKRPWPFHLDYRSPITNATLVGSADKPLSIGHFSARATAWGDDLKHLDLLVEAGLPGTAPARILADVRHDRRHWSLPNFALTLGRSHATGALEIETGGRTKVTGRVVATALDFDDLANAEGRAKAAAKHAAAPNRRIPDTRIALDKLLKTDGDLDIDVRRLLFRNPSAARGIRTRIVLDHGVATLSPFVTTLESGTLAGMIRVTQPDAKTTRLHLDLRLAGSRIEAIATDPTAFSGTLRGRFLFDGTGPTIRAALGSANGRFAIVGSDGTLGRKTALLLGQDIGRGLRAQEGEVARLRCGVGSFVVRDGKARPAPVIIDTSVARAEAVGLVDLTNETMDLSLTGAPKQQSALRLSGPIKVTGLLFTPTVSAPAATSTKGIFRSIRRALSGEAQPLAKDADCAGLTARALR